MYSLIYSVSPNGKRFLMINALSYQLGLAEWQSLKTWNELRIFGDRRTKNSIALLLTRSG